VYGTSPGNRRRSGALRLVHRSARLLRRRFAALRRLNPSRIIRCLTVSNDLGRAVEGVQISQLLPRSRLFSDHGRTIVTATKHQGELEPPQGSVASATYAPAPRRNAR